MKHNYICEDLDCESCGLINKINLHNFTKYKYLTCPCCKTSFNKSDIYSKSESSSGSLSLDNLEETKKFIKEKSKKAIYSDIKVCDIQMHIDLLFHTNYCKNDKCTYFKCTSMKNLLDHKKKCLTLDGSCNSCNCVDYLIDHI